MDGAPTYSLPLARVPLHAPPNAMELPWGMWITTRGTMVLFDRTWRPLFVRRRSGLVVEEVTRRFIRGVTRTVLIYDDDIRPPWADSAVRQRCEDVLAVWREAAVSRRFTEKYELLGVVFEARKANLEIEVV